MGNADIELTLARLEYEAIVKLCADNDVQFEIANRNIHHATILFNAMLRRSKHYVEILTGCLPELFFRDISKELIGALGRGVKVSIITVVPPGDEHDIRDLCKKDSRLKLLSVDPSKRATVAGLAHFYVSDDSRFRIEDPHKLDQDFNTNPSVQAVANFNAPETAATIHTVFVDLLSVCTPATA